MESLLISACLVGENCKYNGGNNALPEELLTALRQRYHLVPVCPEVLGGLPTPRCPSERADSRVLTQDGRDVTAAFLSGAEQALAVARAEGCRLALLKERSPSCGPDGIYDGSFSHRLVSSQGVAAELLQKAGLKLFGESRIAEIPEAETILSNS